MSAEDQNAAVVAAVRCRPFNKRELKLNATCCISMQGCQTRIVDPRNKKERTFAFDHSFWSHDSDDREHIDSQEDVYNALGKTVLDNAISGFNACLFAYGQTGSGKTYSMMGDDGEPGVIPRLCKDLFRHVEATTTNHRKWKMEIAYMEIYNEQVFDLLAPQTKRSKGMRVRNHKTIGPYVEGLSTFAVGDYSTLEKFMIKGNEARTTASTKMNDSSSRSHAIFTIRLQQTVMDESGKRSIGEKASKVSLVDLAGSERQAKTGASGERLKEGSTINKSLTTLGMVIGALAERSTKGAKEKDMHIPYRDSTLTFLLKENLGGNSKTVMLATISPAADNFEESISTLRYADRAKNIMNKAFVNEDATAAIIQQLRNEVEALKQQASNSTMNLSTEELEALKQEMAESQRLLADANLSWEEKLRRTEAELLERAERAEQAAEQQAFENEELRVRMAELEQEKVRLEAERAELVDKAEEANHQVELTRKEQGIHSIETARSAEDAIAAERRKREELELMLADMNAEREQERYRLQSEQDALARELKNKEQVIEQEQIARRAKEEELQKERAARRLSKIESMRTNEEVLNKMQAEQEAMSAKVAKTEAMVALDGVIRDSLERRVERQMVREEYLKNTLTIVGELSLLEKDFAEATIDEWSNKLNAELLGHKERVEKFRADIATATDKMIQRIQSDTKSILALANGATLAEEEFRTNTEFTAQTEKEEVSMSFKQLVAMLDDSFHRLESTRVQAKQKALLQKYETEKNNTTKELDRLKQQTKQQEELLRTAAAEAQVEKDKSAAELARLKTATAEQRDALKQAADREEATRRNVAAELDRLKTATLEQQQALEFASQAEKDKLRQELERLKSATKDQQAALSKVAEVERKEKAEITARLDELHVATEKQEKTMRETAKRERLEKERVEEELLRLRAAANDQRTALEQATIKEREERLKMERQLEELKSYTKEEKQKMKAASDLANVEKAALEAQVLRLQAATEQQEEAIAKAKSKQELASKAMVDELERLKSAAQIQSEIVQQAAGKDDADQKALEVEVKRLKVATLEQQEKIEAAAEKERKEKEELTAELAKLKAATEEQKAALMLANEKERQEKEKMAQELEALRSNLGTVDSPVVPRSRKPSSNRSAKISAAKAAFENGSYTDSNNESDNQQEKEVQWQKYRELRSSFESRSSVDHDDLVQKLTTAEIHEKELATRRLEVEVLKAQQQELDRTLEKQQTELELERKSSMRKKQELEEKRKFLELSTIDAAKKNKIMEEEIQKIKAVEVQKAELLEKELDEKVTAVQQAAREEAEKVKALTAELANAKNAQQMAQQQLELTKKETEEQLTKERDDAIAAVDAIKQELVKAQEMAESSKIMALSSEPATHKVMFAFKAAEKIDLALEEGDEVTVKIDNGDGWFSGFNHRSKQVGIFPQSYVEKLVKTVDIASSSLNDIMKRVETIHTERQVSEPCLAGEPSESLQAFLLQQATEAERNAQRRQVTSDDASAMLKTAQEKFSGPLAVESQVAELAEKVQKSSPIGGNPQHHGDIPSKALKLSVDLKELEAQAQAQLKQYEESAERLLQISDETAKRNAEAENLAKEHMAEAKKAGVCEKELEYLQAKYDQEALLNDVTYRNCLESAASATQMKDVFLKALERIKPLFVALLGVSDEVARNKKIEEAQIAKLEKRRKAISNMAQAPFGDNSYDAKASFEKYLSDATNISKTAIKNHLNVGKHVIQGWLLKPRKDALERWYRRYFILDLRARMVTYAQVSEQSEQQMSKSKKKGEILFKDIISCTVTSPAKLPKRGRTEDGSEIANTFVVVTGGRTWYFATESQTTRDLWVAAFRALYN